MHVWHESLWYIISWENVLECVCISMFPFTFWKKWQKENQKQAAHRKLCVCIYLNIILFVCTSKKVLKGPITRKTAGLGNSEKGDMEGEEERGALGVVIHSYTMSLRYLVIEIKKHHQLGNCSNLDPKLGCFQGAVLWTCPWGPDVTSPADHSWICPVPAQGPIRRSPDLSLWTSTPSGLTQGFPTFPLGACHTRKNIFHSLHPESSYCGRIYFLVFT